MHQHDDPALTDLGNDLRDSFYQMITDTLVLEERAAWGAAALDRSYPLTHPGEDWVHHVDRDNLDLFSGTTCIIGQLYGEWLTVLQEVMGRLAQIPRITWEGADRQAVLHGFMIDEDDIAALITDNDIRDQASALNRYAYRRLTRAWLHEIEVRLAADAA